MPGTDDGGAFGIDAFTLDDRLRLFHFAAAEKRHEYLWLLRAFDRGRANYQMLLHASDAAALIGRLAAENPGAAAVGDVQPLLDALAEWRVLDAAMTERVRRTWPSTATGTTCTSSPRPDTARTERWRTLWVRRWRTRNCPVWSSRTSCRPGRTGGGERRGRRRGGVPQAGAPGLRAERNGAAGRPLLSDAR